jgi:hypothetical protein
VTPSLLLLSEAAAGSSHVAPTMREWLERWHDFYLMAGTAAVTLAGLLFVALSLHLDRLVEETHEHLLALSRVTLLSFTFVLIASLFLLVPFFSAKQHGMMLGAVSVAGLWFTIRLSSSARHHDEAGFSRGQMRRRIMAPLVGYGLWLLAAAGLFFGIGEMLYMMVGGVCMILGNAAGTSWELLVQIAKQKRHK